jgi:hypothetical protein
MPKKFEVITPREGGEEEKVITSDAWRRGERPRGYQETSTITREAQKYGLRALDLFDQSFLSERDTLIDKAETQGLTQTEADKMVTLSKEINRVLNEAIHTATLGKK